VHRTGLESGPAGSLSELFNPHKTGKSHVFFGNKWDLHNNGFVVDSDGNVLAETGKAGADVAWLEAYEYLNNSGMTFDSVQIGIIDTGVRASHHALSGKVGAQRNFCPALLCLIGAVNPDAYADDNGHGTHVATTAAGRGDDVSGIPGVAWIDEVNIISGRVCGGPLGLCTAAGVANAIVWAVDEGADVLNLSLGGGAPSAAQQNALQYALANNVLPVCASGNDGSNVVSFPAAFPECMAVGSSNWSDLRSSYSQGGPQLEVVAPGGDISDAQPHSLILAGWHTADNAYAYAGGTSMATPQVAGLAALLRATGTSSADAVRTRLQETADDLGDPGWDISFGFGRINAYRALTGMDPVIEFDMLMRPSINASANGNLQIVLYGQEAQTFSLEQIHVDSILLGVTPIAYRRNGTPFAVFTDNNGDGLTDLVMHFRIPDLAANGDLEYDAITLHAILDDGRRLRASMEIDVH
jgi:subtilisin family serine protease